MSLQKFKMPRLIEKYEGIVRTVEEKVKEPKEEPLGLRQHKSSKQEEELEEKLKEKKIKVGSKKGKK